MGRMTEMLAYLNSSTEDWQDGTIKREDLSSFTIDEKSKLYRRWYRYGKENTFEEYLQNMKPNKGIAVDGGCSGNPGLAYYRGVDIETGEELFKVDIGEATNNIAEFLAICHALHYQIKNNISVPVFSDSQTAISWVNKSNANTTFVGEEINSRLRKAEQFLRTVGNRDIKKWDTKKFGEIPADFGLKR